MLRWLIDSLATGGLALAGADTVAKATILLGLTTAAAFALQPSAAAVRHRLWALTLCGLIVLPWLSWSLEGWRLPILPSTIAFPGARAVGNEAAAELGSDRALNGSLTEGIASARTRDEHGRTGPIRASRPAAASGSSATARSAVSARALLRVSARLVLVWVVGFILAASPALAGVVGGQWRRRRSLPVDDPDWLALLEGLTRQLALRRPVELRTSPAPLVPMTWGVLRPIILLPEQATRWPEPIRRFVLLHELAHIKRRDVAYQLIGRLAAAVYWFHPLAWYALHRLRVECECACDDHVVHSGARRTDYAQQLVALARSLRVAGFTAAVPMTRQNTLEKRIKALFDERRNHQPLSRHVAKALLAGVLAVLSSLTVIHLGPSAAGQQPRTAPPPASTAAAQKNAPPPSPDGLLREKYTYPINVTGRALDLAGKPIAGARVYLASLRGDYKRIAETTSDAEGRYALHEVPLPIERANTVNGRDEGAFQVFGQAEGYGFAWRPQKWLFPQPRPANIINEPDHRDPPGIYEANDRIELDLRFPPAARLAGTIVDDQGKPRPGVRLEIRQCESLTVVDNVVPGWTLDALNETNSVPASVKLRTTDADGRFTFTGLPGDCRFWIHLRAKDLARQSFFAATTDGPQPDHDGAPVLTGDIRVVFASAVEVPVKMVYGDTGAPAPRVAVQAARGLVNTLVTSDDQGRATLRLPPGTYRMENWPARGTPYLVTEGELVVGPTPPAQPVVAALRPAGIIEVTVVDTETGAGIPDVDVWEQTDREGQRERLVFSSWEVATRIAWRENPRTDARGKLRALVEPGKHRIGVAWQSYPPDHEVVESRGQEVECRPGETVRLTFTMRKRR